MNATRGELKTCPLGANCSEGGRHYENTKVYREHAKSAARGNDVDFDSAYRTLDFPGHDSLAFTKRPDGAGVVSVAGKKEVTVGESMTKALSGASMYKVPPFLQPTAMTASSMKTELMYKDGFSLPVAHAAATVAVIESGETSMKELFGDDQTALSWVADDLGYNLVEGEIEDRQSELPTYDDVAEKMWSKYDMRIERVDGYTSQYGSKTNGKVTLSAVVGGNRKSVEFDIDDERVDHVGKSTLASSIESYAFANAEAEDAASFVDKEMLEDGLFDTLLGADKVSGRDTSMWDNLSTKDKVATFRDDFDAAMELMNERLGEFRADSKKIRQLLG